MSACCILKEVSSCKDINFSLLLIKSIVVLIWLICKSIDSVSNLAFWSIAPRVLPKPSDNALDMTIPDLANSIPIEFATNVAPLTNEASTPFAKRSVNGFIFACKELTTSYNDSLCAPICSFFCSLAKVLWYSKGLFLALSLAILIFSCSSSVLRSLNSLEYTTKAFEVSLISEDSLINREAVFSSKKRNLETSSDIAAN